MPGFASISDAGAGDRAPAGWAGRSLRTGLIGRGLSGSRSRWLHEEEAQAQGFELTYELIDFDVRGLPDDALAGLIRDLPGEGFSGSNVTFPFKQMVMPALDDIARSAELVGAVNTISVRDGRCVGHNTDVTGFADSLARELPDADLGSVLQVGAGGAGAAVAVALIGAGVGKLVVVDVDRTRAAALCARLGRIFGEGRAVVGPIADWPVDRFDGVVNTTPVGMAAYPGLPFDVTALRAAQWVADIIYFPAETALLLAARDLGCRAINGSGMVIAQAALAFEIMTGSPADIGRMRASFTAATIRPA